MTETFDPCACADVPALDLELFYQPIVCAFSSRVMGAEALSRIVVSEKAVTAMPLIRDMDVDRRIMLDRWATCSALHATDYWRSRGISVPVHVNIGAAAHSAESASEFFFWLKSLDIDYSLLTLEITEHDRVTDHECAAGLIQECRKLGLEIAVDDFGLGYATFEFLRQIPTDLVKIDRRFVGRITSDARSATIVRGAIDLAHSLGTRVVAEGVEDDETWGWLQEAGCDLIQGHVVERAIARERFAEWHEVWRRPRRQTRKGAGTVFPWQ